MSLFPELEPKSRAIRELKSRDSGLATLLFSLPVFVSGIATPLAPPTSDNRDLTRTLSGMTVRKRDPRLKMRRCKGLLKLALNSAKLGIALAYFRCGG